MLPPVEEDQFNRKAAITARIGVGKSVYGRSTCPQVDQWVVQANAGLQPVVVDNKLPHPHSSTSLSEPTWDKSAYDLVGYYLSS
jgi:hypothetical protein